MSTALTFLLEIVIDSRLFLRRIDNISATYNQSINQSIKSVLKRVNVMKADEVSPEK